MAQVKIRWHVLSAGFEYPDKHGRPRRGNVCKKCGSPLKDEKSKKRGFGHKCFSKIPVVIVLEIPSSEVHDET
jgi:hypothetical protein